MHSSWAAYFSSGAFALPPALGGSENYAAGAGGKAVPSGGTESTLQGLTGAGPRLSAPIIA